MIIRIIVNLLLLLFLDYNYFFINLLLFLLIITVFLEMVIFMQNFSGGITTIINFLRG